MLETQTQHDKRDVSIIVPMCIIKGNLGMHRDLFKNLYEKARRDTFQLIVVDNGSEEWDDGFYEYPDIFIRYKEKRGFTKAINAGIKLATGKYIVQLNTDVIHREGWIEKMVKLCDETGGVICASTQGGGLVKNSSFGVCWMMNREILDKVGSWDENFNWRYSDQDFWIRCYQKKIYVYTAGSVEIQHGRSETYSRFDYSAHEKRERELMYKKYNAPTFSEWLNLQ